MCGISGIIGFGHERASTAVVERMADKLSPRGPDGSGVVQYGSAALAHRRLKIIDLSERARQPMVDPELGLSIVYNGAIYNYPELRSELEAKGYRFFSSGDTEVLLKAYHAWGPKFVQRLNGMFAFAIVERDNHKVLLGRDRLGIKPLYYTSSSKRLAFASTLPALLQAGDVDTTLDAAALHHYMSFHSVVPPPRTLLTGVQKLPPATTMTLWPDGRTEQEVYWSTTYGVRPEDVTVGFEEWQDRTLEVLRRSVGRRLLADVPVGVLLSGGLDSSLVVGLLAEAGHQHIETFSIGFESVKQEKGDEFEYSDIVARRFGTRHHRIFVDSSRALPALKKTVEAMSEPMVSHDNIGFFLLSEEVSRHVKVVQSGQGADEIFAGYHWYPPLLESSAPLADYSRHFFDRDHEEMAAVLEPAWLDQDHSRAFVARHFEAPGAVEAIDKALRLDSTVMLVDDPVKRVDNMTMAWGLEARVPFLDHEVVEFASGVPGKFKVPEGGKYVLKEAARRVIPHEVIDRPKGYFPVPALKYLRGEYLEFVKDSLNNAAAKQRGVFKAAYVKQLLDDPTGHITPLGGSKLWQVALLEMWLQKHLDGAQGA